MIERELKKKFELASKLAEFSALLDEFKRKFLEERSNKTWNRFSIPATVAAKWLSCQWSCEVVRASVKK